MLTVTHVWFYTYTPILTWSVTHGCKYQLESNIYHCR